MTRSELCAFLKDVACRVIIDDGSKVLSAGSGVVIDSAGTVLTARHVVASGKQLYPGQCLVSFQAKGDPKAYLVEPRSLLTIDIGQPQFMRPMDIDLALLRPVDRVEEGRYAAVREDIVDEGTDVMMAGFSDDVLLPFHFDESLETRNLDMATAKKALNERYQYFMRQLFCRRAMVGLTTHIHLNTLHVATYMLDSELTYGGSGGPVVDYEGRLVAIVVRKGLTGAGKFMIQTLSADTLQKLPSTTGYALSPHLLLKLMKTRQARGAGR